MKRIIIYIGGCLVIAPAIIGILSGSIITMLLSVLYGLGIFLSPSFSAVARRFWREWHKVNFRVTNALGK